MQTCKSCRWWVAVEHKMQGHYCSSPKIRLDGTSVCDGDEARAGGYEGYGDYFTTGPNFGCVHHEPCLDRCPDCGAVEDTYHRTACPQRP